MTRGGWLLAILLASLASPQLAYSESEAVPAEEGEAPDGALSEAPDEAAPEETEASDEADADEVDTFTFGGGEKTPAEDDDAAEEESFTFGGGDADDGDEEESFTFGGSDEGESGAEDETLTFGSDETDVEDAPSPDEADVAGPVTVIASLDTALFVDTGFEDADTHVAELSLVGRLALAQRLASWAGIHVEGRLSHRHFRAETDREADRSLLEVELREAWFDLYLPWVDIRIGNQIYAWGANEGFAPADILNTQDLRWGFAGGVLGGAEGKLPVPSVSARTFWGDFSARVVLMPVFVPNKLWLFGYDYAAASGAMPMPIPDPGGFGFHWTGVDQIQPFMLHTELPPPGPEALQAAARLEYRLFGVDLGLSYFDGWDRFPKQFIDEDLGIILAAQAMGEDPPFSSVFLVGDKLQNGEPLFASTHERMRVVALDLEGAIGPVSIRFDVGYSPGRTLYGLVADGTGAVGFEAIETQTVSGALGLEYLDLDGWTVGLVAHAFTLLDVPSDTVIFMLEDVGDFPNTLPADGRAVIFHGLVAYGRWVGLDERLEVAGAIMYNTALGDVIVAPSVAWRFSDHQRLTLTGVLLEGPENTPGGLFDHNDQIGLVYGLTY